MAVEYGTQSLKTLIDWSEQENETLVLPNFQRDFVWERSQQEELLASFLLGLPIGSLLILKGREREFAARSLCFRDSFQPAKGSLYLLDGQQRISTLKNIFFDLYESNDDWEKVWDERNLFPKLRCRWFVRISADRPDIFGFDRLRFKSLEEFEPGEIIEPSIHYKNIYKKDYAEWYHPAYSPLDRDEQPISGPRLDDLIAEQAAQESLVPLWNLYSSGDRGIHRLALRKLARRRVDELRAAVEGGELSLADVVGWFEPNIGEADEDGVTRAWNELEANWNKEVSDALVGTLSRPIPEIRLPVAELKRAVVIFEETNKTGTRLDLFDLVVARAAKGEGGKTEHSLTTRMLNQIEEEVIKKQKALWREDRDAPTEWWAVDAGVLGDGQEELTKTFKKLYLNVLSILSHCGADLTGVAPAHIKRGEILRLNEEQINKNTERAVTALIRALAFLQARAGVRRLGDLSYDLMILPVAVALERDEWWEDDEAVDKIEFWYWSALFGGRYRGSQTENAVADVLQLAQWLNGGGNSYREWAANVFREPGYSSRQVLLQEDERYPIPPAVDKGILQYVLSRQPRDFWFNVKLSAWDVAAEREHEVVDSATGKEVKLVLDIEDHHIIPLADASNFDESARKLRKKSGHILNSPLNRTYISAQSNRNIRSLAPSKYFDYVSEIAQWKHCVPTPVEDYFNRKENESEEEYYKRACDKRYHEIRRELVEELERLSRGDWEA